MRAAVRSRWRHAAGLILALALALVREASAEQPAIKTYTTQAGLAHNRVKRIVQDSHGFLWFCTGGGLSRFDGYQFISYASTTDCRHPRSTTCIGSG